MNSLNLQKMVFVLFMFTIVTQGTKYFANEEERIQSVFQHLNQANLYHIEIFEENKSMVLYETKDGTRWEAYLEKSMFKWILKREFALNISDKSEPMYISFFESPFENEKKHSAISLRILDQEISKVTLQHGKKTIHDFRLIEIGNGEKVGLFRSEDPFPSNIQFNGYSTEGEIIYSSKPE